MNLESQVLNVPIEDIIPNRFQPRLNFDEDGLRELAASIKQHGIIQPLVLRRLGEKYEIIAGERRYKAAKMAGLISVPAIISNMDDNQSAEVAIVENIQRRDLTAIEEAKSYKSLLDKGYLTQEELAKKMGISQSSISNKLRLLTLDEAVQNALMEGKISERHARSLLKLDNKEDQIRWLNTIIQERLTVQNLDKRLKAELKQEDEIPTVPAAPNIEEIKANAMDIRNTNNAIVNEKKDVVTSMTEKTMPNKFFNFLEDESVNMNITEPINNNFEAINEPNNDVTDDIEMLDFVAPQSLGSVDITVADSTINNLVNELKSKNYKVILTSTDELNKKKYIIEIEK